MKTLRKLCLLFLVLLLLTVASVVHAATKEIIVLAQSSNGTTVIYNVLFWFPISTNPQTQSGGSSWTASGTSTGATTAENAAIQAGTIKEESQPFSFPVGTPVSAIESILQQAWTKRNAEIGGIGGNQFYGSFWDGSVWGSQ